MTRSRSLTRYLVLTQLMLVAALVVAQEVVRTDVVFKDGHVVSTYPLSTQPVVVPYPPPTDGVVFGPLKDAVSIKVAEDQIRAARTGAKFYLKRGETYVASQWWEIRESGVTFDSWGDVNLPQPVVIVYKGWQFKAYKGELSVRRISFTSSNLSPRGDNQSFIFYGEQPGSTITITVELCGFVGVDNILNGNGGLNGNFSFNRIEGLRDLRGYAVWMAGGNFNIIGNYVANSTSQTPFRGKANNFVCRDNKIMQQWLGVDDPKSSWDVIRLSDARSATIDNNEITGILALGPIEPSLLEPDREFQFIDKATVTRTKMLEGEIDVRGNTRSCSITGTTGTTRGVGFVVVGMNTPSQNNGRFVGDLTVKRSDNPGVTLHTNEAWVSKPDWTFVVKSLITSP